MAQEQNNQENNGGKEYAKQKAQFDLNMKSLNAVMRGETGGKKKKVNGGELAGIVDELLAEERETRHKEIKEGLKKLLTAEIQLRREIEAKEAELKKLAEAKYKEFNEASRNLFKNIEGLKQMENDYMASMQNFETAVVEDDKEEEASN